MSSLKEFFEFKDFYAMGDEDLEKEAKQYGMQPGPNYSGYLDREYVINQLIARETRIRNWWFSTFAFVISCLSFLVAVATLVWRISIH